MIEHFLDLKPGGGRKADSDGGRNDYDDFDIPSGMTVDTDAIDRFKPVAKELGLSQSQAQRLVDFYAEQMGALLEQWMAQQEARIAQWQKQSRVDRELAGNGNFDRNLSTAKKAVERFGGTKLSSALAETGAASHPEVLRCFYRIGKAMSEDAFVAPSGKRQKKSYAETFYPDFNP